MLFDWDENKAKSNLDKHGVSFDEATSVFDDPLFLTFSDTENSIHEQRFIIIGESTKGKLLVVLTQKDKTIHASSAPVQLHARNVKHMNQNFEMEDDLRPEYDFTKMTVVARGQGRKRSTVAINLDPDVAKLFPDSSAVNEGLRLLIRLIKQNSSQLNEKALNTPENS